MSNTDRINSRSISACVRYFDRCTIRRSISEKHVLDVLGRSLFSKVEDGALLPNRGLSEVTGIVSTTMLRKTVRERRMVTPETVEVF